jgi:glycine/D-amino acid oxidase-like deaminating enzyme
MSASADVVICGAGMAGAAAAYHLAVRGGVKNIVLVDEREPLTLTSDKGTQAYRNWWPGPDATMLRFITRSIDIVEEIADESGNQFRLSRRGYLFATGQDEGVERLRATATEVSGFGMGPLREHPGPSPYIAAPAEGYRDLPIGADLLLGPEVRRAFPYLGEGVKAALHVRRAGWMNAATMGTWMLTRATAAGVRFVRDKVIGVDTTGGRVRAVRLASGQSIATERFVITAGPGLDEVARLLGVVLPVFHELHAKLTFRDRRGAVARSAPFLIWTDPVELQWTAAERARFAADPETRRLVERFPGGVHLRPVDGPHGDELYLIWTYDTHVRRPAWPASYDPHYGEVLLRGAAEMVPAMAAYAGMGGDGLVDGGYYCKTRENRPLVGPLGVDGAYVLGALSGYGIMAAHAGADLLAAHVTERTLPDYARWFLPSRYADDAYQAQIAQWGALAGQL